MKSSRLRKKRCYESNLRARPVRSIYRLAAGAQGSRARVRAGAGVSSGGQTDGPEGQASGCMRRHRKET